MRHSDHQHTVVSRCIRAAQMLPPGNGLGSMPAAWQQAGWGGGGREGGMHLGRGSGLLLPWLAASCGC